MQILLIIIQPSEVFMKNDKINSISKSSTMVTLKSPYDKINDQERKDMAFGLVEIGTLAFIAAFNTIGGIHVTLGCTGAVLWVASSILRALGYGNLKWTKIKTEQKPEKNDNLEL